MATISSTAATPPPPAAAPAPLPDHVLLYDGVCGFCDSAVQWILDHEGDHRLHNAALQGETAARLRERYPNIPTDIDTVVYVADGRAYLRSKAFLHLSRHLTRPWRAAYHLRWVPAFVLDLGYRLFARFRYRLFGTLDACRIPTGDERARFLP
jgi:predicted DCC family thiol-disulfide oxidoreductase YuxK